MDLSRLSPAPWRNGGTDSFYPDEFCHVLETEDGGSLIAEFGFDKQVPGNQETSAAACDFAALARNAFDVMMRRGWVVQRYDSAADDDDTDGKWYVDEAYRTEECLPCWPDPFTALVEADRFVTAREAQG